VVVFPESDIASRRHFAQSCGAGVLQSSTT
jgi:hypothetical protein